MSSQAMGNSDREAFAAFICDEVTKGTLAQVVADRGWSQDMVFGGGIASAVRALGAMPCPEFLIVDISESMDPRSDMQTLADVCEPNTAVLAIGTLNDVTLYRDLINAGVHDYLVKPLSEEDLSDSVLSAIELLKAVEEDMDTGAAPTSGARQVIFIGVRGGLGASTMAANTAWLAAERGDKAALLDLDLYFGTDALQFDLEPGRGLVDALENPSRVDSLFLERAVVKPHENLSILAAEAPVGHRIDVGFLNAYSLY